MFSTQITPETVLTVLIFLGIGFPVHEFSHALAAYLLGDSTAKVFGRLTLNPVRHFDPVGGVMFAVSVLFLGFGFGWAKPTPVNPSNLRDRRNGEVVVALAGPASNLIMAAAGALVFRALGTFGPTVVPDVAVNVLYYFVLFNLMLAVFNIIPVPPLDGSTVLFRLLDPATAWRARVTLGQYGFVVLILGVFLLGGRLFDVIDRITLIMLGVG